MEKMNDLRDLFKHEIEDLQSVEDQILEALPKMIDKANNPDLKKALQEHLQVTEQHKSRLEKIMQNIESGNEGSNGKKKGILGIFGNGKQVCKGMKGIIEEGEKIMSSDISPEALDAAIIASAQKVEHYEICGYGTARTFARELGMEQVAKQLEQTLNEEYEADDILTSLAVMRINEEAETRGGSSPSASSRGRSSGRVKEKANREMEMEPVSSRRSRSSGRSETTGKAKTGSESQSTGHPKTSGTPRGESGRSSSSSKRIVSNERNGKTSGRNGRSSTAGRGGTSKGNSRGRK
ncbi:MAG TPA: ferritin-like domain-containing protein [Flavisolibacter sp.]|jgi:ferritin-like metal-binding protein YciE|nr:ferritin-like domain-containing protein [Flavisolibacter sp.]